VCNNTVRVTLWCEVSMAFEDSSTMAKNTDVHTEHNNDQQTTQQQLADAHNEIEELKLQIAWLERAYE